MITLRIVTPSGVYRNYDCSSVSVRTVEGQLMLLPNHMPLIAQLVPCHLVAVDATGRKRDYALAGGFLSFDNNQCTILSDAIEGRSDINLDRARQAYQRARNRIDKKDSTTNMRRAELSLKRAINRINVYNDSK